MLRGRSPERASQTKKNGNAVGGKKDLLTAEGEEAAWSHTIERVPVGVLREKATLELRSGKGVSGARRANPDEIAASSGGEDHLKTILSRGA